MAEPNSGTMMPAASSFSAAARKSSSGMSWMLVDPIMRVEMALQPRAWVALIWVSMLREASSAKPVSFCVESMWMGKLYTLKFKL